MDQPFEIIVFSAVHQFSPLGFHSDFRQKPAYGSNADLRPVVSLGQMAFPLGTSHNEESLSARFDGMKEVLTIRFAAAWQHRHLHPDAILSPLARQMGALWNAPMANIDGNTWM
jgi:hypothetical protein